MAVRRGVVAGAGAALARGQAIWDAERALHLPSERTAQALILPYHPLVHWLNVYYALVHVPALGVCLVWAVLSATATSTRRCEPGRRW